MDEDETYDKYLKQIKDVLAKAKEGPYDQRRADLGRAYRTIQQAADEEIYFNSEQFWVMYYLLVDELDREQVGNGDFTKLSRILAQCAHMGLFVVDFHWRSSLQSNILFLKNVQYRLTSRAWQLSKAGEVTKLCQFVAAISPSLDRMFRVDYKQLDDVYSDRQTGKVGMAAMVSSVTGAVSVAMRKSPTLPLQDIANLASAKGELAARVAQGLSTQLLAPHAWQLVKADDSAGLRDFLHAILPFVGNLHASFAELFTPFDVGLHKHHPEQLAQSSADLTALIAALGIANLTFDDYYQHKEVNGKTYPSVADNVVDLYLALNQPDIPITDDFDQRVKDRIMNELVSRAWEATKQNNPQQLAAVFKETQAHQIRGRAGKMLLPYYLGLYQHQKEDRARYAALWEQVVEFFGFDTFSTDELREKEKEGDDDHALPSLAEQIISSYIKSLQLTGARDDQIVLAQHGLEVLIQPTMSRDWIVYQLGKVLEKQGRLAKLDTELLDAVMDNQRNTYFWSMLAARYRNDDPEKYQGALAMAVSLPNARLADIAALITVLAGQDDQHALIKGLVALAKTTAKGKEFPPVVHQAEAQDWYRSTPVSDDVSAALQELAKPVVGDLLYGDEEPMSFFVCWNSPERNSTGIALVSEYGDILPPLRLHDAVLTHQVKTGHFYQARIVEDGKHVDYYGHLQPYEPDEDVKGRYVMHFNGERLDRNEKNSFGFLHFLHSDCFVPDDLISKHQLHNGDVLSGTAWVNWNSKKEEWGWQLGELEKVEAVGENQVSGTFEYQQVGPDRTLGFVILPDGRQRALVPEEFLVASEFDDNEDVVATVTQHWNRNRRKWELRVTKIAPANI